MLMSNLKVCGKWSWLILDNVTSFLGAFAKLRNVSVSLIHTTISPTV
jgi:hypothetical protein